MERNPKKHWVCWGTDGGQEWAALQGVSSFKSAGWLLCIQHLPLCCVVSSLTGINIPDQPGQRLANRKRHTLQTVYIVID